MDRDELETLAAAFRDASTAAVLSGLALGWSDDLGTTMSRREWAKRANLDALMTEPQRFWEYLYPTALDVAAREPNTSHRALARMQDAGLIAHHITQSVDRLHTRAGSVGVIEVFGNLLTVHCGRCGERYGLPEMGPLIESSDDGVPRCTNDGCDFPLRPTGTLWGEPLPPVPLQKAWELAAICDVFIAFDCNLRTAPISLLPSVPLTKGTPLYIVGEEPTQYDRYAAQVIRSPSRELLPQLAEILLNNA
jgi:NAD-dependent deacetylase